MREVGFGQLPFVQAPAVPILQIRARILNQHALWVALVDNLRTRNCRMQEHTPQAPGSTAAEFYFRDLADANDAHDVKLESTETLRRQLAPYKPTSPQLTSESTAHRTSETLLIPFLYRAGNEDIPGLPPDLSKSVAIGLQAVSKGRQSKEAANLVEVCATNYRISDGGFVDHSVLRLDSVFAGCTCGGSAAQCAVRSPDHSQHATVHQRKERCC